MQKKILFVAFIALISIQSFAQFKRGDKMAGTTIFSSFYNSGTSDQEVASIGSIQSKESSHGITLSPALGWFISDNTVIGGALTINFSGKKNTYEGNTNTTFQSDKTSLFNLGLGAFARHYFQSSGSLLPFGQLGINGGTSNSSGDGFFYGGSGPGVYKDTYDTESSGGFFANTTFTAGVTKMLGERTALDFFIGYTYTYNKSTVKTIRLRDDGNDGSIDTRSENKTTTKFTNHGVMLGVAFQIFIFGKK